MSGVRLWLAITMTGLTVVAMSAGSGMAANAVPLAPAVSLQGVACPTAKACVAVGFDESFNGKSAVIATATGKVQAWSGMITSDAMNAVACPGKSACLAVSNEAVATVKASNAAMKVTDKLKAPTNGIVALIDLACASAASCYAVGFEGGRLSSAIVVHLSGAGKQLGLLKGSGTGIGSIACPSSAQCLVTDHFKSGPEMIAVLAKGRLGSKHKLPAKTFVERLACFKTEVCFALAGKSTSGFSPVDELFPVNPKTGAVGKVIKMSGFSGDGIACASATKCVIVGFTGVGANASPAVVTVRSGKPGKPAKLGPAKAVLANVACASATVCYAVGNLLGKAFVIKA